MYTALHSAPAEKKKLLFGSPPQDVSDSEYF